MVHGSWLSQAAKPSARFRVNAYGLKVNIERCGRNENEIKKKIWRKRGT